jgi:hypothetical protein
MQTIQPISDSDLQNLEKFIEAINPRAVFTTDTESALQMIARIRDAEEKVRALQEVCHAKPRRMTTGDLGLVSRNRVWIDVRALHRLEDRVTVKNFAIDTLKEDLARYENVFQGSETVIIELTGNCDCDKGCKFCEAGMELLERIRRLKEREA